MTTAKFPAAVSQYVFKLSECPLVESIWLGGSRSAYSRKNPRSDSDWDIQAVTRTKCKKSELPQPIYPVDLFVFDSKRKFAQQLWPIDECGML